MRLLLATFLFCAGFSAGGYVYSKMFDPIQYTHRANETAMRTYEVGCFQGIQLISSEYVPTRSQASWCHEHAAQLLQTLESL